MIDFKRTDCKITCGITNIPLTYPAKIWFLPETNDTAKIKVIKLLYVNAGIEFIEKDLPSGLTRIISTGEIPRESIKSFWRNWKTYHPKFESLYRYLHWELDNQDTMEYDKVLSVYEYLNLPVLVHKTMRGYHFVCVKPIEFDVWKWATDKLRPTNKSFPSITLRILGNKYSGEFQIYSDVWYVGNKRHADSNTVRTLIVDANRFEMQKKSAVEVNPNIERLTQDYQIVWYAFEGNREDNIQ